MMELRTVVAALEGGEQDAVLKVLQVYNREVSARRPRAARPCRGFCAARSVSERYCRGNATDCCIFCLQMIYCLMLCWKQLSSLYLHWFF